jgi:hypothetical protein
VGVVYTMDHEVIPRTCKIWDWLLNFSWDHFGLHQGKKCESDREVRSPKDIFEGLHYPLTWSNKFCGGRGKRGGLVEKGKGPWQKNVVIMFS